MSKERLTLVGKTARGLVLMLVLSALAVPVLPTGAVSLSLGSAYAIDPLSGAALEGYDAVSYFTEPAPVAGRPEFEYYWADVPWYFATEANRDVFIRSPETYVPMFGGYATMSMARGFLSSGNPRIYTVLAGRLFLFYSSGNKEAFLLSPRDGFLKAQEHWTLLSIEKEP
jgi:YHS domain-containing protein